MHWRNRVFGQPALDEAQPGGGAGAIMRHVLKCSRGPPSVEDGNGSSSKGPTGRHALGVHGTAIYMEVRCTPHLSPGVWPTAAAAFIVDKGSEGVWWRQQTAEALRTGVRLDGRALDKPAWQTNHDTPL